MPLVQHQKLPTKKKDREELRDKGQFWTPDWVAEAMVAYAIRGRGSNHIFDPGVGAGAFFRAAKKVAAKFGRKIKLLGTDIDPAVLEEAMRTGLSSNDLKGVEIRDFLLEPPTKKFDAIVANPPYIRHHRLSFETKEKLKEFSKKLIGFNLDGRAGYHIYFLLKALELLNKGGRLAFIVPADTVEGVFSEKLWNWITNNFRLDGVVTFLPEATPFPNIDTNAIILLIRNEEPVKKFFWASCKKQCSKNLFDWISGDFGSADGSELDISERFLEEALATGLSRPFQKNKKTRYTLGDFATAMRGIATGANEFFLMTLTQATEKLIHQDFLVRVVARSRDAKGDIIDRRLISSLDEQGKPTALLSLDGREKNEFPKPIQQYLNEGEKNGLNERALIRTRRPWYKMEIRKTPPILFAYLGRRNARFVRNQAGIVPLTGFLCVYPRQNDKVFVDKLWQVLSAPETINNLKLVGKSYGDGAIKVEPRSLEKLPLPDEVVKRAGLFE